MKRIGRILFIAAFFVALPVSSQSTLTTVTVIAPKVGGGTIVCMGIGCGDMLRGLQEQRFNEMYYDQEFPYMGLLEDVPIHQAKFCSSLKATRPAGCNQSNPPASPGIQVPGKPPYMPNGCGTGKLANVFADAMLEVVSRPTYSGDFQAPYPGVSFQSSCNGHDTCWASGGNKEQCDYTFRDDMISACGGNSPQNNVCLGFAGLYHGAVSTTGFAQSAYSSSIGDRSCAVWAENVRANSCN